MQTKLDNFKEFYIKYGYLEAYPKPYAPVTVPSEVFIYGDHHKNGLKFQPLNVPEHATGPLKTLIKKLNPFIATLHEEIIPLDIKTPERFSIDSGTLPITIKIENAEQYTTLRKKVGEQLQIVQNWLERIPSDAAQYAKNHNLTPRQYTIDRYKDVVKNKTWVIEFAKTNFEACRKIINTHPVRSLAALAITATLGWVATQRNTIENT